jgi:hypothetical protein
MPWHSAIRILKTICKHNVYAGSATFSDRACWYLSLLRIEALSRENTARSEHRELLTIRMSEPPWTGEDARLSIGERAESNVRHCLLNFLVS